MQRLSSFRHDKTNYSKKTFFTNAPVRQFATAMNTNSTFAGSYAESPFWYQQFELRQYITLRFGQSFGDFVAADLSSVYVTRKAIILQDDNPQNPIDSFDDYFVVVFYLTSMKDAIVNCQYPKLSGKPMKL